MTARTILDVIPIDLWGVTLHYLPPCAEKYLLGNSDDDMDDTAIIGEVIQWGNVMWDDVFEAIPSYMLENAMDAIARMLGRWGSIKDIREYLLLQTCDDGLLSSRLHDIIYNILDGSRIGALKRLLQLQHDPELCDRPSISKIWEQAVSIFISECNETDRTAEIFAVLELDTRPMDPDDFEYLDIDDGANGVLIECLLNSEANRSEMVMSIAYCLDNEGVSEWMIPLFKRLDHDILTKIAEDFHGVEPEDMLDEVLDALDASGCTVLAGLIRDMAP